MDAVETIIAESTKLLERQEYVPALKAVATARRMEQFKRDRKLALHHAVLLEKIKSFPEALQLYKSLAEAQAQAKAPTEGSLVIGMARCLLRTGRPADAQRMFEQVIQKAPKHPDVLVGLAECQRLKSDFAAADAFIARALDSKPDYPPAIHEKAEVLIARKDDDGAIATLEKNAFRNDLHGDSLDLWLTTLKRLGRDRYTQEKLADAMRQFPERVEYAFGYGVVTHRAGEIPLARPALELADKMNPQNPRILHELGVLERTAGNIPLSQSYLERSLTISPEQPAALRSFGTEYKYSYGDAAFTRLGYAAAQLADLSQIEQVQMHYALGKAFEDVGELDTAFRHYEIAGRKKRKLESWSERNSARMVDLMVKHVTAETFAATRQRGSESQTPVFILGMPRSGTSLLEQILSSHGDVFGAGELKFLSGVLDNIIIGSTRMGLNDAEPVFKTEENASWAARGDRFAQKLEALAGAPYKRIVDKMPGNYSMIGLIHAILPNAKIIHSRRHPVETCLSNYRIHFGEGQLWSYNLRELGRQYRRYDRIMRHWRQEFPGVVYDVRYEDNVADVEGQARKLIEYLGLEWRDECLSFYNTERPVRTASATQVRKPIYTTSTNRWRKYEKYLGPLLEELGDLVPQYEAEIAHLTPKT